MPPDKLASLVDLQPEDLANLRLTATADVDLARVTLEDLAGISAPPSPSTAQPTNGTNGKPSVGMSVLQEIFRNPIIHPDLFGGAAERTAEQVAQPPTPKPIKAIPVLGLPEAPDYPDPQEDALEFIRRRRGGIRQRDEARYQEERRTTGAGILPRPVAPPSYDVEKFPKLGKPRPSVWRRAITPTKQRLLDAWNIPGNLTLQRDVEQLVDDEIKFRMEYGLWDPADDQVERREWDKWYQQQSPEFQEKLRRAGIQHVNKGRAWWDTSRLEENVHMELANGAPLLNPDLHRRQMRLYEKIAKLTPEQLPAARGFFEKIADFGGNLAPFLAEFAAARRIIGPFARGATRAGGMADIGELAASGGAAGTVAALHGATEQEALDEAMLFGGLGATHRLARTPLGRMAGTSAIFGAATAAQGGDVVDVLIAGGIAPVLFHLPDLLRAPFRPGVPKGQPVEWRGWAEDQSQVKKLLYRFNTLAEEPSRFGRMDAAQRQAWESELRATGEALQRHTARATREPNRYTMEERELLDEWVNHYDVASVTERMRQATEAAEQAEQYEVASAEDGEVQDIYPTRAAAEAAVSAEGMQENWIVRPHRGPAGPAAPPEPPGRRVRVQNERIAEFGQAKVLQAELSEPITPDELAKVQAEIDRQLQESRNMGLRVAPIRVTLLNPRTIVYPRMAASTVRSAFEVLPPHKEVRREQPTPPAQRAPQPPTPETGQPGGAPTGERGQPAGRAIPQAEIDELIGRMRAEGASDAEILDEFERRFPAREYNQWSILPGMRPFVQPPEAQVGGAETPEAEAPPRAPAPQEIRAPAGARAGGPRYVVEDTTSGGFAVRDRNTNEIVQTVGNQTVADEIADEYNSIEAMAGRQPEGPVPLGGPSEPPGETSTTRFPASEGLPSFAITRWRNGVHIVRFNVGPNTPHTLQYEQALQRIADQGGRWHQKYRGYIMGRGLGPNQIRAIVTGVGPQPPKVTEPGPPAEKTPAASQTGGGLQAIKPGDVPGLLQIKDHREFLRRVFELRGYKISQGPRNLYATHPSDQWRYRIQPRNVRKERKHDKGWYTVPQAKDLTVKRFADQIREEIKKVEAQAPPFVAPPRGGAAPTSALEARQTRAALERNIAALQARIESGIGTEGQRLTETELHQMRARRDALQRELAGATGKQPPAVDITPATGERKPAPVKEGPQLVKAGSGTKLTMRVQQDPRNKEPVPGVVGASVHIVPGEKGTGAYNPVIDFKTDRGWGGFADHGGFFNNLEQAQTALRDMLKRYGLPYMRTGELEPMLYYTGAWKPGAIEKWPQYNAARAKGSEAMVSEISDVVQKAGEEYRREQLARPAFGDGPPLEGQEIVEEDVGLIPELVQKYGDFWVGLKWSRKPQQRIKASALAKHYEQIVADAGVKGDDWLRMVWVIGPVEQAPTAQPATKRTADTSTFRAFVESIGAIPPGGELPRTNTPEHKRLLTAYQAARATAPGQPPTPPSSSPTPSAAPGRPTFPAPGTDKRIQKFRDAADKMQHQIDSKKKPAISQQRTTARRARIAEGMYREGESMEQVQAWLRAIADRLEAGTLPDNLAPINSRAMLEDLQHYQTWPENKTAIRGTDLKDLIEKSKTGAGARKLKGHRKLAEDLAGSINYGMGEDSARLTRLEELDAIDALAKHAKNRWVASDTTFVRRWFRAFNILGAYRAMHERAAARISARETLDKLWGEMQQSLAELTSGQQIGRTAEEREAMEAERGLIGQKIPGFFPTPKRVIDDLIDRADVRPGDRVLEPSAGKGDIAEALREEVGDEGQVDVYEVNSQLQTILKSKGFKIGPSSGIVDAEAVPGDFFGHTAQSGQYDKIVMNPPFELGADMDHVQHAYDTALAPGGRLVSIMSVGVMHRDRQKERDFRDWLEQVGGVWERLDPDAFQSGFRPTGVQAIVVTIDKPEAAVPQGETPAEPVPKTGPEQEYVQGAPERVEEDFPRVLTTPEEVVAELERVGIPPLYSVYLARQRANQRIVKALEDATSHLADTGTVGVVGSTTLNEREEWERKFDAVLERTRLPAQIPSEPDTSEIFRREPPRTPTDPKVTKLKNRKTKYEVIAKHQGGDRVLLVYTDRKNYGGLKDALTSSEARRDAMIRLTGVERVERRKKGAEIQMGHWTITFSGRTQRQALLEGAEPFVVDVVEKLHPPLKRDEEIVAQERKLEAEREKWIVEAAKTRRANWRRHAQDRIREIDEELAGLREKELMEPGELAKPLDVPRPTKEDRAAETSAYGDPLTDLEKEALRVGLRDGPSKYPIEKAAGKWFVRGYGDAVGRSPEAYNTRKAAVEQYGRTIAGLFERASDLAPEIPDALARISELVEAGDTELRDVSREDLESYRESFADWMEKYREATGLYEGDVYGEVESAAAYVEEAIEARPTKAELDNEIIERVQENEGSDAARLVAGLIDANIETVETHARPDAIAVRVAWLSPENVAALEGAEQVRIVTYPGLSEEPGLYSDVIEITGRDGIENALGAIQIQPDIPGVPSAKVQAEDAVPEDRPGWHEWTMDRLYKQVPKLGALDEGLREEALGKLNDLAEASEYESERKNRQAARILAAQLEQLLAQIEQTSRRADELEKATGNVTDEAQVARDAIEDLRALIEAPLGEAPAADEGENRERLETRLRNLRIQLASIEDHIKALRQAGGRDSMSSIEQSRRRANELEETIRDVELQLQGKGTPPAADVPAEGDVKTQLAAAMRSVADQIEGKPAPPPAAPEVAGPEPEKAEPAESPDVELARDILQEKDHKRLIRRYYHEIRGFDVHSGPTNTYLTHPSGKWRYRYKRKTTRGNIRKEIRTDGGWALEVEYGVTYPTHKTGADKIREILRKMVSGEQEAPRPADMAPKKPAAETGTPTPPKPKAAKSALQTQAQENVANVRTDSPSVEVFDRVARYAPGSASVEITTAGVQYRLPDSVQGKVREEAKRQADTIPEELAEYEKAHELTPEEARKVMDRVDRGDRLDPEIYFQLLEYVEDSNDGHKLAPFEDVIGVPAKAKAKAQKSAELGGPYAGWIPAKIHLYGEMLPRVQALYRRAEKAYRNRLTPVDVDVRGVRLWAEPGKERAMQALGRTMGDPKALEKAAKSKEAAIRKAAKEPPPWKLTPKITGKKPTNVLGKPHDKSALNRVRALKVTTGEPMKGYRLDLIVVTPDQAVGSDGRQLWVQGGDFKAMAGKNGLAAYEVASKGEVRLVSEDLEGGANEGVAYAGKAGEAGYQIAPAWVKYMPELVKKPIEVDIEQLAEALKQALVVVTRTADSPAGLALVDNRDGTIGVVGRQPEVGMVQINVWTNDKAHVLGVVDGERLLDQLKFHWADGDKFVSMSWADPEWPLRTDGANTTAVLMPLNPGGALLDVRKMVKPGLYRGEAEGRDPFDRFGYHHRQALDAGLRIAFRHVETGEVWPQDGDEPRLTTVPEKYWLESETMPNEEVVPVRADLAIVRGYVDDKGEWVDEQDAWYHVARTRDLQGLLFDAGFRHVGGTPYNAKFDPRKQDHREALGQLIDTIDQLEDLERADIDEAARPSVDFSTAQQQYEDARRAFNKLVRIDKPPRQDWPLSTDLRARGDQVRSLRMLRMQLAVMDVSKLNVQDPDGHALEDFTPEQLAYIRQLRKEGKPAFGMGAALNIPDMRTFNARIFDSIADRLQNMPPGTIRRRVANYSGRLFQGYLWGMPEHIWRRFEKVKGANKWANLKAAELAELVREGVAERQQTAAAEDPDLLRKQYHRELEDVFRGDLPYERLDDRQKRIFDMFARPVRYVTDKILANPWMWPDLRAFGLLNIEQVIAYKREGPGVYLRRLYEIEAEPERYKTHIDLYGRRSIAPRIRGSQFKIRRGDEDLYYVMDATGEGQPKYWAYASEEEARHKWDELVRAGEEQYGLSVFEKIKILDPFSVEELEASGVVTPIRDIEVLMARTLVDSLVNLETIQLFDFLDKTLASETEVPGYIELPKSAGLGTLAGKWVPEHVAYALFETVRIPTHWISTFARGYMHWWKGAHVKWSPSTQSRNLQGVIGFLMLDTAPAGVASMLPAAAREIRDQGPAFEALVKENELQTGWNAANIEALIEYLDKETLDRMETLTRWWQRNPIGRQLSATLRGPAQILQGIDTLLGQAYDFTDSVFKLASYMHKTRRLGWTHDEALRGLWMYQNYDRPGNLVRALRHSPFGEPFVAFAGEALRIFGMALRNRLMRLLMLPTAVWALDLFSRLVLGADDDEVELLNQSPIRRHNFVDRFFQPIVPWRTRDGRLQTWDVRWTFPLANDFRVQNSGGVLEIPFLLGQPYVAAPIEALMNRSQWTGRDLWDADDSILTKWAKATMHVSSEMVPAPPLLHKPGQPIGGGIRAMYDAWAGNSGKNPYKVMLKELFGINVREPWIRRDQAFEMIRDKVGDQNAQLVGKLVTLFNEIYREESQRPIKLSSIGRSARNKRNRGK